MKFEKEQIRIFFVKKRKLKKRKKNEIHHHKNIFQSKTEIHFKTIQKSNKTN